MHCNRHYFESALTADRSRLAKSQALNDEAKLIVSHLKSQLAALSASVTGRLHDHPPLPLCSGLVASL